MWCCRVQGIPKGEEKCVNINTYRFPKSDHLPSKKSKKKKMTWSRQNRVNSRRNSEIVCLSFVALSLGVYSTKQSQGWLSESVLSEMLLLVFCLSFAVESHDKAIPLALISPVCWRTEQEVAFSWGLTHRGLDTHLDLRAELHWCGHWVNLSLKHTGRGSGGVNYSVMSSQHRKRHDVRFTESASLHYGITLVNHHVYLVIMCTGRWILSADFLSFLFLSFTLLNLWF